MFPDKEVISYSDNLLGITPFYALFRLFGFDYLSAFQLLILLCHILNFTFCYYCFHKISGNKYAAAFGAFIFAFSIALDGMHNHPQYSFRFCIPLFFYFMYIYLNTFQLRSLVFALLFLIIQFYLGIYLGYFLLIVAGFFIVCHFIFNSPTLQKLKKMLPHFVLGSVIFLVCLLPLFYFYYKRNQTSGYYTDYDFYMETIPRLSSYLRSFSGSVAWFFLRGTDVSSKYVWLHILFPGIIIFISIILSAILIFKGEQKKLYLTLLISIFVFILFTINYNGHTLYGYLMKIPGIKAARVVSRFVSVLIFFGAWLVCLNITYIQTHFVKYAKLLVFIFPIFLVFDNYCLPWGFKVFNKEEGRARVENLKTKIEQGANNKQYKAFAYIPAISTDSYIYQVDAMLCALKMKTKTVNGYSSSAHKEFGPFWRNIDSTSLSNWCRVMNLPIDSVQVVK